MTKHKIRYGLIGADQAGVKQHPQLQTQELGMKVLSYEGVPIGDCIIMEVENMPEILPEYIDVIES